MTENLEQAQGCPVDIEEASQQASQDVIAQREEALAKQLAEMRRRKRRLVDPLQFEMSIQAEDLTGYVPAFGWEMAPPSAAQQANLEKAGILPDEIESAGKAKLLLDRLAKRRQEGLTTPKQIRFLEGKGFRSVGTWSFDGAKRLIDRIASNSWRTPGTSTRQPTGRSQRRIRLLLVVIRFERQTASAGCLGGHPARGAQLPGVVRCWHGPQTGGVRRRGLGRLSRADRRYHAGECLEMGFPRCRDTGHRRHHRGAGTAVWVYPRRPGFPEIGWEDEIDAERDDLCVVDHNWLEPAALPEPEEASRPAAQPLPGDPVRFLRPGGLCHRGLGEGLPVYAQKGLLGPHRRTAHRGAVPLRDDIGAVVGDYNPEAGPGSASTPGRQWSAQRKTSLASTLPWWNPTRCRWRSSTPSTRPWSCPSPSWSPPGGKSLHAIVRVDAPTTRVSKAGGLPLYRLPEKRPEAGPAEPQPLPAEPDARG